MSYHLYVHVHTFPQPVTVRTGLGTREDVTVPYRCQRRHDIVDGHKVAIPYRLVDERVVHRLVLVHPSIVGVHANEVPCDV